MDRKLYREDIEGSLAHAAALARQGIISPPNAGKIRKGLLEIRKELEKGIFNPEVAGKGGNRFAADDIHMAIEQRLIAKIGDAGGKLHTARSRNDQVALDGRLYLRGAIQSISGHIRSAQRELLRLAEKNRDVIMPAYTHLQRAQPVLFAHHLIAYVSMLDRDAWRFADASRRVNLSPLGAAAATGTSFPVDRSEVARTLRFDGIIENSIDAVSDRDVHLETIAACAITMMHLSRLAEELVLWSTKEWNFITIGDAFTTGSSIMPQKKNPDIAELIRGKTGRVYGDLMALLTVMKGLPLAQSRGRIRNHFRFGRFAFGVPRSPCPHAEERYSQLQSVRKGVGGRRSFGYRVGRLSCEERYGIPQGTRDCQPARCAEREEETTVVPDTSGRVPATIAIIRPGRLRSSHAPRLYRAEEILRFNLPAGGCPRHPTLEEPPEITGSYPFLSGNRILEI